MPGLKQFPIDEGRVYNDKQKSRLRWDTPHIAVWSTTKRQQPLKLRDSLHLDGLAASTTLQAHFKLQLPRVGISTPAHEEIP